MRALHVPRPLVTVTCEPDVARHLAEILAAGPSRVVPMAVHKIDFGPESEQIVFNRIERTLRTVPERIVCHFTESEALAFRELWAARGHWIAETDLAARIGAGLGLATSSVRSIRLKIGIFDLFIVSRGQRPAQFRLVRDAFANSPADAGSYSRSGQARSANEAAPQRVLQSPALPPPAGGAAPHPLSFPFIDPDKELAAARVTDAMGITEGEATRIELEQRSRRA